MTCHDVPWSHDVMKSVDCQVITARCTKSFQDADYLRCAPCEWEMDGKRWNTMPHVRICWKVIQPVWRNLSNLWIGLQGSIQTGQTWRKWRVHVGVVSPSSGNCWRICIKCWRSEDSGREGFHGISRRKGGILVPLASKSESCGSCRLCHFALSFYETFTTFKMIWYSYPDFNTALNLEAMPGAFDQIFRAAFTPGQWQTNLSERIFVLTCLGSLGVWCGSATLPHLAKQTANMSDMSLKFPHGHSNEPGRWAGRRPCTSYAPGHSSTAGSMKSMGRIMKNLAN